MALVRICPVCSTRNAPAAQRCTDCGAARCVYCDRPLAGEVPAAPALRAAVHWPWGEVQAVDDCLVAGREPPAPPGLAARLEREFTNVSRRHAELRVRDGALWITDPGSTNGTFVNGTRLAPREPVRLPNAARVRFAARLEARIELEDSRG